MHLIFLLHIINILLYSTLSTKTDHFDPGPGNHDPNSLEKIVASSRVGGLTSASCGLMSSGGWDDDGCWNLWSKSLFSSEMLINSRYIMGI